jgi:hypothetical protein
VELEQLREVGVHELVAVEREQVTLLTPRLHCEADTSSPSERFPLGHGHDLRTKPAERRLEGAFLAGRAADEHARHPRRGKLFDLIGGERPAGQLDKSLRAAARGLAKTLGLPAGQDDRLHER